MQRNLDNDNPAIIQKARAPPQFSIFSISTMKVDFVASIETFLHINIYLSSVILSPK